jgi:hypothetical protein
MAFGHFLDDRPEEAALLLEPALILREEPVEIVKKHPVENRAFWMTRTIDSGHSRSHESRNRPIPSGKGESLIRQKLASPPPRIARPENNLFL